MNLISNSLEGGITNLLEGTENLALQGPTTKWFPFWFAWLRGRIGDEDFWLSRYVFREQGLEKLSVASAHLARSGDMQTLADVISQAAQVSCTNLRACKAWQS